MVVTTYCYISGGEWLLTGEACRVILCKTKFPSFVIKYFCLKKKKKCLHIYDIWYLFKP